LVKETDMPSFSERNVSRDTFIRHVSRDTGLNPFLQTLCNLPLLPVMCY